MLDDPRTPYGELQLSCRPDRADGNLVFPYEVRNTGPLPLLVMDAWPRLDDGKRSADPGIAQVLLREDGVAVVGKFVPAIPPGMRIAVPVLPLCVLLRPGESLTRELRLPLPFAEQSPYLPDLTLRRYQPRPVQGLVFAIGWWPQPQPGLAAAPASFAPELQTVAALDGLPVAGTATQRFPTTRLEILRRGDALPRQVPTHPDLSPG
jgi:hypothetical protein